METCNQVVEEIIIRAKVAGEFDNLPGCGRPTLIPLTASIETEFSKQILIINRRIFDYNLSVPVVRLQRRTFKLEEFQQSTKREQEI